ncbi:MAG TPA: zf-HC2 domain-containing protein [Bryobacteraceae bacterium]
MMDHAEASRKLAVEQYLLGELSGAEREEFEEHFFYCSDCAAAVDAGSVLMANARKVLAQPGAFPRPAAVERKSLWLSWSGWRLVPAAALAGWALVAVLGYQVLRGPSAGQLTIAPAVSVRAARAQQSLTFSRRQPAIAFEIVPEWQQSYIGYEAQIERAADHKVVFRGTISGEPVANNPLTISLRTAPLQPGSYLLTFYGLESAANKTPLERISFTLTE